MEIAEAFADGRTEVHELILAGKHADAAAYDAFAAADGDSYDVRYCTAMFARRISDRRVAAVWGSALTEASWATGHTTVSDGSKANLHQVKFVHDVFGNPFRPVPVYPTWRTPTAVAIAQAIYDERAFGRLPILADALEDAGCTHVDLLNHCRQPGEHVRGCWALDLVLGKE